MDLFARTLARVRKEAGFPTAYRFYHGNGGRRHFPFTYVHYLRFERGVSTPRSEWMPLILFALRLPQHSLSVRELCQAFLRKTLGTEEAYQAVVAPLLAPPSAAAVHSERAAARYRAHDTVHLSPTQFEAVAADETVYWCSELIFSGERAWNADELAAELKVPVEKTRRALAALKAAKLLRPGTKGRFKARGPGRLYSFPGRLAGMKASLAAIEGYWEKMAARRGGPVGWRKELVWTSAAAAAAYTGRLLETLDSAADLAISDKDEGSGFYQVTAEVKKVMPY